MKYDPHFRGKHSGEKRENEAPTLPLFPAVIDFDKMFPEQPIYFDVAPLASKVQVRLLHSDAKVPEYATPGASGFDLVAMEDVIIQPGETKPVKLGLAFEIAEGYEIQIRPRSGISLNTPLRIANNPGTIDSDYRGEVAVLLWNSAFPECDIAPLFGQYVVYKKAGYFVYGIDNRAHRTEDEHIIGTYRIRKGDRIAQGVLAPVVRAQFEVVDELSETERGGGKFGSTGTR
jgi:dUTP pyrophosphatase